MASTDAGQLAHSRSKGYTELRMKYATDPKHKVPTMAELTSDLALRYMDTKNEQHNSQVSQAIADSYLMALARILYDVTGHIEWRTKSEEHRLATQKARGFLLGLEIKAKNRIDPATEVTAEAV